MKLCRGVLFLDAPNLSSKIIEAENKNYKLFYVPLQMYLKFIEI